MSILRVFTVFLLTTSAIFAQKTTSISFKISGYSSGKASLVGVYADQNYLADTAKILPDGSITFKKNDGYTEGLYYLLLPDQQNFQLLIAGGENPKMSTKKGDLINAMTVANSLENQLLYENIKYQSALERQFNALNQVISGTPPTSPQYDQLKKQQQALLDERDGKLTEARQKYPNSLYVKFKLAGQNPKLRFAYKADGSIDSMATMVNFSRDWWNDFDFADGRLAYTPVLINKLKKYLTDYTAQTNDSLIAAVDFVVSQASKNKEMFKVCLGWTINQYKPTQTKYMDGEAVYAFLIEKYYKPNLVDWETPEDIAKLQESVKPMKPSLLGKTGQDVRAQNKDGVYKSLYEINANYVIVYIYNPDCEHCQEETPRLRKVYDEWKNRGVEVFSIAANTGDFAKWQAFAKKYGVNWVDVWDPQLKSGYHLKYNIDITPELYILDKNHKIIAKNLKPVQVPEVLQREFTKAQ